MYDIYLDHLKRMYNFTDNGPVFLYPEYVAQKAYTARNLASPGSCFDSFITR